ncbi:FK506-binding protein 2B [Linderina pennispora]|nr:FK506-binding protein 2B [Linderina pennispora]
MAAELSPKWTAAELASDDVSKKDLISYLQESASNPFLLSHKLNGKLANVAKTAKKPALITAYDELFATKQFRAADEISASEVKHAKVAAEKSAAPEQQHESETPKYVKKTTKRGTGQRMPSKGDRVSVYYTGMLEDGTVFDTNLKTKGRKPMAPLVFKVGTGQVIRGWDEALMTMVAGEKARLTIESEWAYGRHGHEAAGIPPHATLVFDVELVNVD